MESLEKIKLKTQSIYRGHFSYDLVLITEEILAASKSDSGRMVSNVGGYQSNNLDYDPHTANICPLTLKFYREFENYVVSAINSSPHFTKKISHIDGIWINVNGKDAVNGPHTHQDPDPNIDKLSADYSGVFYVKTLKDQAPIVFWDSKKPFEYFPKNNEVLIFPHTLLHAVYPHDTDDYRISIAFNFG